jgi:peroxiredoxin/tetratricopeptide (TPR) repeat protein
VNSPIENQVQAICLFAVLGLYLAPAVLLAQENSADVSTEAGSQTEDVGNDSLSDILAGHSYHGGAFNEGPRQKAYLMGGTGDVQFPVTTKSELAQRFINQGVGQLHGFWDLEAERSFRQAAALDPDCAMAYWGAAWAAVSSRERAQGFVSKAVELKDNVSKRERMYIEALEKYLAEKPKEKKKRAAQFLKDLESILIEFPDDLEAKAFVAHRVWQNARDGIPIASYLSTDALLKQIYAVEPLHPAHHYTIHLWDRRHPENAVESAARCGIAAPSIAHMWHMPGHIYSRLKRYEDAIYQQEASARVDHAHMMRDHVMPDEIGNFAHNNEWLIRNLVFVGRVNDALDLAKNMVELPRHPKYNTFEKKNGSASYGRRRLLQTLREFGLYSDAIELCSSHYLDTPDVPLVERIKCLRLLGCAAAIEERDDLAADVTRQLKQIFEEQTSEKSRLDELVKQLEAATEGKPNAELKGIDKNKAALQLKDRKKELADAKARIDELEEALLAVEGYALVAQQEYQAAFEKLEKATGEDVSWLAELQFLGGDADKGLEKAQKQVERRRNEVIPLARLAFLQHQNGDIEAAQATFEKLRTVSGSIDPEIPMFARLRPIADALSLGENWIIPYQPSTDLGFRPPLDTLGPFRWSPPAAPSWSITDSFRQTWGKSELRGQPHLLIFYLGHGCLHCAEQLQEFAPRVADFEDAGIKILAISSDDEKGLQKSLEDFSENMPIRLASDEKLELFRQFRAFDDFENQPLHGTFLIDGAGRIRWQDIGYEPFMDDEFLLTEAKRLLAEELLPNASEQPVRKLSKN